MARDEVSRDVKRTDELGARRTGRLMSAVQTRRQLMVALALCAFLGYLGVHRLYLRQRGMGLLYLLTVGCFLLGWVHDLAVLMSAAMRWGRVYRSPAGTDAAGPELWTWTPDVANGASRRHGRARQRGGHAREKSDAFDPAYVDPEVSETFPGIEPVDAEELYLEREERAGRG